MFWGVSMVPFKMLNDSGETIHSSASKTEFSAVGLIHTHGGSVRFTPMFSYM